MSLPTILAGTAMLSAVKYTAGNVIDSVLATFVTSTDPEAQKLYENATEKLNKKRRLTKKALENLGKSKFKIYRDSLVPFRETFAKLNSMDLKELHLLINNEFTISQGEISELTKVPNGLKKVLSEGLTILKNSGLAGLAAGGATRSITSSSMDKVIVRLKDFVAENATLSWIGGGSYNKEEFDFDESTSILGGISDEPVLIVGGLLSAWKDKSVKKTVYADMKRAKLATAQLRTASISLGMIVNRIRELDEVLQELDKKFKPKLSELTNLITSKNEFGSYSDSEKSFLSLAVAAAHSQEILLAIKPFTHRGSLTNNSQIAIKNARKVISRISKF